MNFVATAIFRFLRLDGYAYKAPFITVISTCYWKKANVRDVRYGLKAGPDIGLSARLR